MKILDAGGVDDFHANDDDHTFHVGNYFLGLRRDAEVRLYVGGNNTKHGDDGDDHTAVFYRVEFAAVQETKTVGNTTTVVCFATLNDGGSWANSSATGETDFKFTGSLHLDKSCAPATCSCSNCTDVSFTVFLQIFSVDTNVNYGNTVVAAPAGSIKVTYSFGCWPFTTGDHLELLNEVKTKGDFVNMTGPDLLIGAGAVNFQDFAIDGLGNHLNISVIVSHDHDEYRHDGDGHDEHHNNATGQSATTGSDEKGDTAESDKQQREHEGKHGQDWTKDINGIVTLVFPAYTTNLTYDPVITFIGSASAFSFSVVAALLAILANLA